MVSWTATTIALGSLASCASRTVPFAPTLAEAGVSFPPTQAPTPQPPRAPTPQPTPVPSPQSAPAPAPGTAIAAPGLAPALPETFASAKGDPHLQNIHGERFDLLRPGKYVLIHIPRRAPISSTMLHVEGDVQRAGLECEMYFQELNITGRWASLRRDGGFKFCASRPRREAESKWLHLGKVGIKIVHGRTGKGTRYLNFYVKHLATTGFVVGGLLGEDDHTTETKRPSSCNHRIAL